MGNVINYRNLVSNRLRPMNNILVLYVWVILLLDEVFERLQLLDTSAHALSSFSSPRVSAAQRGCIPLMRFCFQCRE